MVIAGGLDYAWSTLCYGGYGYSQRTIGMHKHFRMIAISEHLKTHGCNGYALPQTAHTTIPGIWEKLGSLYNLEVLDFRVGASIRHEIRIERGSLRKQEDNIEDPKSDEAEEPFYEFALPDENYSDLTFARRLDPEAPSSPPLLPHQLSNTPIESGRAARRYSTVDDTDGMHTLQPMIQRAHQPLTPSTEPRSSPASTTRGTPTGRSTRASKNTRSSRLAEVSLPGGGGRQVSKAPGDQGTEEEVKGEDGGDDDGMDVDEDENKVTMHVDKGKASKGALGKVSKRRSGRNK